MSELLFELPLRSADRTPGARAIVHRDTVVDYASLGRAIDAFAAVATGHFGTGRLERIAVYLPKLPETVTIMFGTARAGCTFVPVNPLLKPAQVGHILRDCNVRVLVTSGERAEALTDELQSCTDLRHLVLTGGGNEAIPQTRYAVHRWQNLMADPGTPRD